MRVEFDRADFTSKRAKSAHAYLSGIVALASKRIDKIKYIGPRFGVTPIWWW